MGTKPIKAGFLCGIQMPDIGIVPSKYCSEVSSSPLREGGEKRSVVAFLVQGSAPSTSSIAPGFSVVRRTRA